MLQITNVSDHRMDLTSRSVSVNIDGSVGASENIRHFRSQLLKYPAEPCPLKSGMSCHQNFFPL